MAGIGDERNERRHVARGPGTRNQCGTGRGRIGRSPGQMDEFVEVSERDCKAPLKMRAVAWFGKEMLGPPGDDLLAKFDERKKKILQRQDLRSPAVEPDHVTRKARLQRGKAPELI